MGHGLGRVGILNHGVTFNLGFTKGWSLAIFEAYFSYQKDIWIDVIAYCVLLPNCTISFDSYTPINKLIIFTAS